MKTNINKDDLEVGHPHNVVLCLPFLVELDFGNVGFGEEGKTPVPREKHLEAREKTNHKLNLHIWCQHWDFNPATLLGVSASTTVPLLLPKIQTLKLVFYPN